MKISSVFDSLDTVFHYTKLNVALEYILYDKKLRLFPRRNAHDPIEKTKPIISAGGVFGEKDDNPEMI